jgi:tetratricopeptide (TPR) repeat protein
VSLECGDLNGEGTDLSNLGHVYMELGEFGKASESYRQHLELARATGNRMGEADALGSLGNVHLSRREYDKARECFEQHLEIALGTGDRRGVGTDYINLGVTYVALRRLAEGVSYGTAALEILEEIEDPRVEEIRVLVEEWKSRVDEN